MNGVPRRRLRDTLQRIIGDGAKIVGALKTLKHSLEKRTADGLKKWKLFIIDCHKGKLLDSLRSYKLQSCLSRIAKRTLRSTSNRFQGNGNVLNGVFKSLEHRIKNLPRSAISMWKN